jgi:integrase
MNERSHPHRETRDLVPAEQMTFNLALALPGRVSSVHTQRAYFRWIDRYLADTAQLQPTVGAARLLRMQTLPVPLLTRNLNAPQLRAWLGELVQEGHGKQGVNQARASIVTLASILAEAGWLDDYANASMHSVRTPNAEGGQRTGRWLAPDEIRLLMHTAREMATSDNQRMRNDVLMALLCTMALRREEIAHLRWGDISLQNERLVLRVRGKGRKVAMIDVPRPVLVALDHWRSAYLGQYGEPAPAMPIVCRLYKGGRLSRTALTPESIWRIIHTAARLANLGAVAPHDLRRSVAGALQLSGVPIETIRRLLRHANVAVTERYLSRLPQRNEGAVLMSEVLGLE